MIRCFLIRCSLGLAPSSKRSFSILYLKIDFHVSILNMEIETALFTIPFPLHELLEIFLCSFVLILKLTDSVFRNDYPQCFLYEIHQLFICLSTFDSRIANSHHWTEKLITKDLR